MDVGVCGAGVGGLALAGALVADGHRVQVLERTGVPDAGGAAVTIFSNGMAAATCLGVDLGDLGGDVRMLRTRLADGRTLMRADLEPMRRATGFGVRTIPRRDLVGRLAEHVGADVLRYGHPVHGVRIGPDGATALLARGVTQRYDVVVGADGHRSAVRTSVLGDRPATPTGWVTWQGLGAVLPEIAADVVGEMVVGDAGLVGMMPAGGGLAQWWFDTRTGPADIEADGPAAVLRERFGDYPEPVPTLLASLCDADLGRYPHVRHRVPRRWGRGPVTLLGDAAHAFPPTLAQGANQTLEDVWLLRRALGALPSGADPCPALRDYERRRAGRVRIASHMARTERTNRVPAAAVAMLARRVPAAWFGRAHLLLLRRLSTVLADGRGVHESSPRSPGSHDSSARTPG